MPSERKASRNRLQWATQSTLTTNGTGLSCPPAAPDQTETDSSMMFIIAKPATAIALRSSRLLSSENPASSSPSGCDSKPSLAIARWISGIVVSGRWLIATRLAVKLTRAAAIPGTCVSPVSIFEMHPAQRIPGTANNVSGSALIDAWGAGAFILRRRLCDNGQRHGAFRSGASSGRWAAPRRKANFHHPAVQSAAPVRARGRADGWRAPI